MYFSSNSKITRRFLAAAPQIVTTHKSNYHTGIIVDEITLFFSMSSKYDNIIDFIMNGDGSELPELSDQKDDNPAHIYFPKVNHRHTKVRCEICSKLEIKTPEQHLWRHSAVFIVNFEHAITHWE